MRKIVLLLLLPLLLSCNSGKIEELEDKVNQLELENSQLEKQCDELKIETEDLNSIIEERDGRISELEIILFNAKKQANGLQSSMFLGNKFLIESDLDNLISTLNGYN